MFMFGRKSESKSPAVEMLKKLVHSIECDIATMRCDRTIQNAARSLSRTNDQVREHILNNPVAIWKLRHREIVDRMHDGVLLLNDEMKVVYVNNAFLAETGSSYERYLGKHISEVVLHGTAEETKGRSFTRGQTAAPRRTEEAQEEIRVELENAINASCSSGTAIPGSFQSPLGRAQATISVVRADIDNSTMYELYLRRI